MPTSVLLSPKARNADLFNAEGDDDAAEHPVEAADGA